MKNWRIIAIAGMLFGCATASNVKTDFDAKADFVKYKTYAFVDPKEISGTGLLSNSLIQQRVEGLLNENLQARKLRLIPLDQNPDLVVQYWVGIENKTDVAYIPGGHSSYGPYYSDHWKSTYDQYVPYEYREGTLVVDLIDRETKNLVWRAHLIQTLVDKKDANLNNARKALQKAFADYPPHAS